MTFFKFLKSKGPLLSALILLLYGVLTFMIYFYGYKPVPQHIDRLPITLVNQDKQSNQLNDQLKKSLHSSKTVHETNNLNQAVKDLKARRTYMVIDIPSNFTQRVTENKSTKLNFYINEANQMVVVSGLKSIANNIGQTVNNQVGVQKGKAILTQAMVKQLTQQNQAVAAGHQAQLLQRVTGQVNQAYSGVANSVSTDIHRVNKVAAGLNNAMAPFFISLSAYLTTMIGSLLMYGTYAKFAKMVGRFKSFAMMEGAFAVLSIIGGFIIASILILLTGQASGNLMSIMLVHLAEIFAAYNLNAVLILLLGQMGIAVNILITMLQMVASAGMVPVQLMSGFFKTIHGLSPMYYSVMSDCDLLYSNVSFPHLLGAAGLLAAGYLVVNLIVITFRQKQPMVDFAKLA